MRVIIIVLIVLIALLVAADFAARAFAENKAASEIQQQGFPKKPSVDIEGFPFLTQVAAHQFHQINISSTNDTEGPLDISEHRRLTQERAHQRGVQRRHDRHPVRDRDDHVYRAGERDDLAGGLAGAACQRRA